jgi:LysM repeat protein
MSDGTWIRIADEKIVSGGRTYYMHRIEKGQTLYSIAKAYKVTILDIDRENSIPPGGIREGQVLKIPASTALTVIEARDIPDEAAARPDRPATAEREVTADGTVLPRQETQLHRQETPRQETQLPRQEKPVAKPDAAAAKDMADRPAEAEKEDNVKPDTAVRTEPEARQQAEVQQQAPATSQREEKQKPVQSAKKKVHKVQKGESLSDIAKKYGITVQELKQANKGVIFAMPDMRLVIPVREEE